MKMNLRKTGILLAWATIIAANGTAQNVQRTSQGIKYAAQGMDVSIEFYSPTIVRVYKTLSETASDKESLVVTKAPEQTSVSFGEKGKNVTLSSNAIQVEVNPATGGIHFFDTAGQRLLTDKDYGTQFTPFNDAGVPSYNVRQAFLLDKDEVIYGLGQQQTGKVNQRNQKLFLRNQNMSICIPFIHSIKGYALYWDNYSPTTFLDNPQETSFDSEVGDCADYYFIYGGNDADGYAERDGWYAALGAEMKTSFATPFVRGWYASGDDADSKGSNRMLTVDGNGAFDASSIYFDANGLLSATIDRCDPAGTWGVQAGVKDVSFIEDLTHALSVTYFQGTNNTNRLNGYDAAWYADKDDVNYMTTADSAWSIDFLSSYKLYQNLTANLLLSYLITDFDESIRPYGADGKVKFDNAFRGTMNFTYAF